MIPPSAVADLERELGQAVEQIQRDPTRDHGRAYRRPAADVHDHVGVHVLAANELYQDAREKINCSLSS